MNIYRIPLTFPFYYYSTKRTAPIHLQTQHKNNLSHLHFVVELRAQLVDILRTYCVLHRLKSRFENNGFG